MAIIIVLFVLLISLVLFVHAVVLLDAFLDGLRCARNSYMKYIKTKFRVYTGMYFFYNLGFKLGQPME